MEWISVKDRLPKNGQMCDCWQNNWGRKTDYEYEGEGIFYNNAYDQMLDVNCEIVNSRVTHWMLLPAPPINQIFSFLEQTVYKI